MAKIGYCAAKISQKHARVTQWSVFSIYDDSKYSRDAKTHNILSSSGKVYIPGGGEARGSPRWQKYDQLIDGVLRAREFRLQIGDTSSDVLTGCQGVLCNEQCRI